MRYQIVLKWKYTKQIANPTHASRTRGQTMRAYSLVSLQLREDQSLLASGMGALDHSVGASLSMLGINVLRQGSSPLATSSERRDGTAGLGQTLGLGDGRHVATLHLHGANHVHERPIDNLGGQHLRTAFGTAVTNVLIDRRLDLTQTIAAIEMS